jgi:tetratricopeptide (TPR) repeat protein
MKQLMMLLFVTVTMSAALAQTKNVNKANNAYSKGELAEAAALIEPATKDEKTKIKGRTWYIRGQIYGAIYMSDDSAVNDIDAEALKKAVDSYNKVLELESEGSSFYGLATLNLVQLTGSVMNKGVAAFQNEDYEAALESFSTYTTVAPEDTTGFIYAALMAQQLQRYEDVVKFYEGAFNLGHYPKSGLNSVIYYELNKLDNPEKALEFAKLAQEKYPDENSFNKTEVDILIKLNKLDDAIDELKEAIEKEPENAFLYTNLGLLYDSQDKPEAAVEQYKKALEFNPSDRYSLINLAVFYVGQGDEIYKKAIDMDISTYRKEGAKVEEEARVEWKKAIPYLEKVLETDDTDELALQNIHAVYIKLKDVENAKKIEDRRRELGYMPDGE